MKQGLVGKKNYQFVRKKFIFEKVLHYNSKGTWLLKIFDFLYVGLKYVFSKQVMHSNSISSCFCYLCYQTI